ncbi:family 2A encapsulin nanocompartment cargo protein cysteine desulfurase [Stenotrophobium rhamnosiphilum]|uniref:cysteine desulfurase n=1 Tax=Stenotrophobium rhamnosiphilum TaxID=2029166 RepID=A0A2T5MBZ9_9GAMM|nr:family 2A encapsulin nanocompartment cargo protein cysteine desulfurase [Stenotrophobium rhamnosiphilum]PTU30097.1 cysteine desulfurase [Stenotrophobium rhamnosiphilum]
MTTQIPTSSPSAASGLAGVPDLDSLTALANQFFTALPGAGIPNTNLDSQFPASPSRPVSIALPGLPGVPTLPQANQLPLATSLPYSPPVAVSQPAAASLATPPSVITPRVLPTQAQSLDAHAVTTTTSPAITRGGPALGVPEAYAAGVPVVAPVPAVSDAAIPSGNAAAPTSLAPASPFYFLNEGNGAPQARGQSQDIDVPRSNLPFDLSALSSPIAPAAPIAPSVSAAPSVPSAPSTPTVAGAPTPPNSPAPSSPYYFVGESSSYPSVATPIKEEPAATPSFSSNGIFDVHAIRRDFPILQERVNGRQLVWFDNAATTQKPQAVIDRIAHFYAHENSNIHRAAHELAARATDAYEGARNKVARFIGASSPEEIIFVRGATEAINLVAQSWGWQNIGEGDEIIVSNLEHHANIVPWQMLAAEKGAKLRVIPVDDTGQVRLDEYQKLLNDRTKIVAVTQVSNALGTVVPVKEIIELGHRAGAKVLIDGAQSVSHLRVNVQALDADFFVFSGHKIFGPTGIGVVYGKREILEDMPPYQGGGNMIEDVTFDKTIYHGPPARFEAGTGNIADAVGLGAALDYLDRIGLENVARYEHELLEYGMHHLRGVPGLRLIGTAKEKTSVMSFVLDGFKTEEVGKALNQEGIAVRSGHHCAQPILRRFGVEATVRPSIAFYNTHEEIDRLITTLHRLVGQRR